MYLLNSSLPHHTPRHHTRRCNMASDIHIQWTAQFYIQQQQQQPHYVVKTGSFEMISLCCYNRFIWHYLTVLNDFSPLSLVIQQNCPPQWHPNALLIFKLVHQGAPQICESKLQPVHYDGRSIISTASQQLLRSWIHNILGAIRQTSGSGSGLIWESWFKSWITFGWG